MVACWMVHVLVADLIPDLQAKMHAAGQLELGYRSPHFSLVRSTSK